MLDNLNAQEEAMTQMFSGTCNKEERTFTVRLTPDKEFNNEVAFRFSKKLGVVANNDLAGTPFYISLKDLKSHTIFTSSLPSWQYSKIEAISDILFIDAIGISCHP